MSRKLKLGVVGTGNIYKGAHAAAWTAHPEVEIAAFCDANLDSAKTLADRHGVAGVYADYKEMLAKEELDIVDVTAPNKFHSEISIAALRAGKHVFCEKPDAVNPSEAQKMADEAKRSGKILMTMRNNRFRPAAQFLKKYIENGHMGEIYAGRCGWQRRWGMAPVGWFTNKALSGGGPLIDLGVHFIDLSIWLMGNPKPVSVSGSAYNKFGGKHLERSRGTHPSPDSPSFVFDVEDLASGFIRFDNGASLQIEFSWASHIEEEKTFLELRGSEAGFNFSNRELKLFTEIEGVPCNITPVLAADHSGHTDNIRHFVDCVQLRAKPTIVPEGGVDMIKILCAIYESAETGSEVKL